MKVLFIGIENKGYFLAVWDGSKIFSYNIISQKDYLIENRLYEVLYSKRLFDNTNLFHIYIYDENSYLIRTIQVHELETCF